MPGRVHRVARPEPATLPSGIRVVDPSRRRPSGEAHTACPCSDRRARSGTWVRAFVNGPSFRAVLPGGLRSVQNLALASVEAHHLMGSRQFCLTTPFESMATPPEPGSGIVSGRHIHLRFAGTMRRVLLWKLLQGSTPDSLTDKFLTVYNSPRVRYMQTHSLVCIGVFALALAREILVRAAQRQ